MVNVGANRPLELLMGMTELALLTVTGVKELVAELSVAGERLENAVDMVVKGKRVELFDRPREVDDSVYVDVEAVVIEVLLDQDTFEDAVPYAGEDKLVRVAELAMVPSNCIEEGIEPVLDETAGGRAPPTLVPNGTVKVGIEVDTTASPDPPVPVGLACDALMELFQPPTPKLV